MRWIVLAGSIAAYLFAAKVHGHQLRIERELAGYFEVVFGGSNPPFVAELWSRERTIYWSIAASLASVAAAYAFAASRLGWARPLEGSWIGVGLLVTLWPMTLAFLASGLASAWRSGSIAPASLWWLLSVTTTAGVILVAWRKPL
jgi:hypothetical protein